MKKAGLTDDGVCFFDLHIQHDDDHAKTIEEIVLSYTEQADWFEKCEGAMIRTLDERDTF